MPITTNLSIVLPSHADPNWDTTLNAAFTAIDTAWGNLTLDWSKVTSKPTTFASTWTSVSGKPTSFPPSAHTHLKVDITDFPATWAWADVSGKPSFAPVSLSGLYSDLSGLPSIPTAVSFKTNGTVNGSQAILNLKAGANITLADDGVGGVTITSAASGGAVAWGAVTGTLSSQTDLQTALNAKAATSSLATVATSGAYSDLTSKPTLGTSAAKDIPASGDASASQIVYGTDTRLTNARTPSTHASTHVTGSPDVIPSAVAAGNAGLMTGTDKTKLDGIATGATVGADWNTNVANKPTLGALAAKSAVDYSTTDVTNKPTLGTSAAKNIPATGNASATEVVYGTDSRLTDSRTPTAHNQAETTITFTDVTTNNASTSSHGYLPKLDGTTSNFLRGDGTWTAPPGGGGSPQAVFWVQEDGVVNNTLFYLGANAIMVMPFILPYAVTFGYISQWVGSGTGNYDWGIYTTAGTRVAHVGARTVGSTGITDLAIAETSVTLQPGAYLYTFTGTGNSGAIACSMMTYGGSNNQSGQQAILYFQTSTTTSGGALPSSITVATSPVSPGNVGSSPFPIFKPCMVLHQ